MDTIEARRCTKCGEPVTLHDIFDDYGPSLTFVAVALQGENVGRPVATDVCLKCGTELTVGSTAPVGKSS